MTTEPNRAMLPRLALTTGDPNGIGPEVLLKCLADDGLRARFRPLVVGSPEVLRLHAGRLGFADLKLAPFDGAAEPGGEVLPIVDPAPDRRVDVRFGMIREDSGRLAMLAVEKAVRLCMDGTCEAMITAPISKEAVALAGYGHPGHTEFIAEVTGGDPLMLMVADTLRVGLVTGHIPLREVADSVTSKAIVDRLGRLDAALRSDFGVAEPRIAVLGLNPHAGDGGVLGSEEREVHAPALAASREQGITAFGPFPADGFFASGAHKRYDGVLAMYHDQGLVPFKAFAFGRGVNCTAGLSIVRTSPDHGTAFDIAGSGTASPDSFRAAVELALEIAARRAATRA